MLQYRERSLIVKTASGFFGSAAPVRRLRELTFGPCAVVASIRVNLLEAQSTRSTSNCCRFGATCNDTSSPSHLPNMALPKGASLLMT